MSETLQSDFFLGVDGGATRCRARLRDAAGQALADVEGPAANIYVDFERGLAVVRETTAQALARGGLAAADRARVALGVGLAGLSSRQEAARVAAALPGWRAVSAVNDAIAACLGAHGGADGGLIIAGTGSAGAARVEGRDTIIGGRGFLLGDDGAAARIGADALRAALRAHDGLQIASPLTQSVMRHFSDDPLAMLNWALTAKPSDYGAFAPQTLAAAAAGDAVAIPIVEAAAAALGALAAALEKLGAPRLVMVGGLAGPIRPYLPPSLAAKLRPPLFDAVDGAILAAGGVPPKQKEEGRRA
ncbi:MAG TPA: BadF/BadG/BcrA/BcrD ATPase family protein [Roseiarcus sp.]|nr:BadF/BadG/BcrA/BcrD ATPase family protein [Roseiarcus sp.]